MEQDERDELERKIERDRKRANAKEAAEIAKMKAKDRVLVRVLKGRVFDEHRDIYKVGEELEINIDTAKTLLERGRVERADPMPVVGKKRPGRPKKQAPEEAEDVEAAPGD